MTNPLLKNIYGQADKPNLIRRGTGAQLLIILVNPELVQPRIFNCLMLLQYLDSLQRQSRPNESLDALHSFRRSGYIGSCTDIAVFHPGRSQCLPGGTMLLYGRLNAYFATFLKRLLAYDTLSGSRQMNRWF